jgi:hypothetical protein
MEPEPAPIDKSSIRLPLPGYAKWAVRIWLVLFLASPLLVFFRFSILQILFMFAVLGGFVLPFLLGRLPGELEEAANGLILLNPRAHRYAWLALLGRDNPLTNPRPRRFSVPETRVLWEAERLSLDTREANVLLGYGAEMEPVRDWLVQRGLACGRETIPT